MDGPLAELEQKIGYQFARPELLVRALTHRSKSSEIPKTEEIADNEQLEFLGDAVLGFVASEALVLQHPLAREGRLSQAKANLVSSRHLHACAVRLGLGEYLLLGRGEELNGGRERRTVLADAVEAIIAAIHLDGGIEAAKEFVRSHVLALATETDMESSNAKSLLQERAQALGFATPQYATVATSGPEHAKIFTVEVRLDEQRVARASGSSKKAASQLAAELLMQQLEGSPTTA